MESIIEIKNISKEYKSGEVIVKALDDVSFNIIKGKIVILLGRSGSGKSTLVTNLISEYARFELFIIFCL